MHASMQVCNWNRRFCFTLMEKKSFEAYFKGVHHKTPLTCHVLLSQFLNQKFNIITAVYPLETLSTSLYS